MKPLFVFLFSLLILASCTGKYALKNEIKQLEAQLSKDNNSSDSILEPLLRSYANYIHKYPNDKQTPLYLYKVGSIYIRMQNWNEAAKHFEFVIDTYKDSDIYPESILLAAYAQETTRANKEERAAELYKMYLDKFPNGSGLETAKFYFQPEDIKMRSRIAEYQNQLYNDNGNINRQTAHLLISQYLSFVRKYKQNDFSPNYCFEGGKLASAIGESGDALEFWLTILDDYPNYRLYPETMLLLAVEFETKMPFYSAVVMQKDTKKAKSPEKIDRFDLNKTNWNKESEKLYKKFLELYPKHELADQVKASMSQLGKSPNEVVMGFTKNLETKSK